MKTNLLTAPSLRMVSPVPAVGASWQGYLAPAATNGTGMTMTGFGCDVHVVMPVVVATVPFAAAGLGVSTAAATATVTAVAVAHQVVTAPKQAEKPNNKRNDVFPLGIRPGAPPS